MIMAEKKILAILRESTVKQEIESQKEELTAFLIGKGFSENEIEYLEAKGASAHQANQAYLDFLEEIKNIIETSSTIRTVALWHLNRLGRIKKYLTDMEHYFVTNQIQMYVKNGFDMPLLDKDGKETIGASISFSVYSAMVEVETSEMFAKMNRGKQRNKAEGKYNGGRCKLGYMVDENGYFVINEETANVIHQIYSMFLDDDKSCNAIYHHFADLGIFKPSNNRQAGSKVISRILQDGAYIGKNNHPAIISKELQEKAIAKIALFPKRHAAKNVYFCSGLIKDAVTGFTLTPSRGNVQYYSQRLDNILCLNMNAMDYACWFVASYLKDVAVKHQSENDITEYNNKIEENIVKIATKEKQIKELEAKIDRAINLNLEQPKHFSKEKMNKAIQDADKGIDKLRNEIVELNTDNARMKQFLSKKEETNNLSVFVGEYTDTMKKEIINSMIDKIIVTKIEKGEYHLQFINKIGYLDNSYWIYQFKGHKVYLYFVDANGAKLDFSKAFIKNKRFERIRYDYQETSRKLFKEVYIYDKEMILVKHFKCLKDAADTLKIDYSYFKKKVDKGTPCKGYLIYTNKQ